MFSEYAWQFVITIRDRKVNYFVYYKFIVYNQFQGNIYGNYIHYMDKQHFWSSKMSLNEIDAFFPYHKLEFSLFPKSQILIFANALSPIRYKCFGKYYITIIYNSTARWFIPFSPEQSFRWNLHATWHTQSDLLFPLPNSCYQYIFLRV